MVIDSHEHIMFPTKIQLDRMDAAGVDKAILFCSAPHPEKAGNLNELETEMNALYKILAGANKKEDNMKRLEKNISEITTTVNEYPNRFWFCSVGIGLRRNTKLDRFANHSSFFVWYRRIYSRK